MTTIDREYEYKSSWAVIIFCAIFFGAGAAVLGNAAATNDRGLVINGIIPLTQNGATTFYWFLCALSIGFVAISALLTVHRLTHHQRIAFTPQSIILPSSRWSSEETTINYDDITSLSGAKVNGQRFLYVFRNDGKQFTIAASLLPTRGSFNEVGELLHHRIRLHRE